jgi:hypothetical protein
VVVSYRKGPHLSHEAVSASPPCGDARLGGAISSWWWCNRVNGSPFYGLVGSTGSINVGLSSASSFSSFGAGETLVVDLTNGFLPDTNGELGLYNTNSFGTASAIEDYVLWGANGIRDSVAANAGIWTDDQSIDISSLGAGQSVQLGIGLPGNGAADYLIGTSSLGASNVPEPSRIFLTMMGAMMVFLRRRR